METQQASELFELLLKAREDRQQQKMELVTEGFHLVSLQLNIPGLPKTDWLLKEFISLVDDAFSRFLISHNSNNQWSRKLKERDEAGDAVYYLFKASHFDAPQLKVLTEQFEQSFVLGRIVDLDVLSTDGEPISFGRKKACFICDHSALHCRKNKRHSIDEVRQAMLDAISVYIRKNKEEELVNKVAGFAVKGLLHEVSLSPKPGLVCRHSAGAHTDMDFTTFVNTIAVLSPYFVEINRLALAFKGSDVSKALPEIRIIGLKMEQSMQDATNGVNTHKGAIFLMAISCFAMVRVINKLGYLKLTSFSSVVQQLSRGLVQRELCAVDAKDELTHGQQCFIQYGLQAAGARGEAEQGLPMVLHHGLPFILSKLKKGFNHYSDKELKELLIPVLLKIMSVNNDTNVLYRHNRTILEQLKQQSAKSLLLWEQENKQPYNELVDWCNSHRISPGGSADLLALTISLYCCQTEFSKKA